MYLIHAEDAKSLSVLAQDLDAIDDFEHVDLGDLNTLELYEITDGAASEWEASEPVFFDEEAGLMIVGFSLAGVLWLRDNPDAVEEFGAKSQTIADFASLCKDGQIYCLDTF